MQASIRYARLGTLVILWRNAEWLRLEAAVVVSHKVGGGFASL
jgi:hypothetical protein